MGLLITFVLGVFILIGAGLTRLSHDHEKVEHISIALACGTMIMLVFLDLIPEAVEHVGSGRWYLIALCAVIGVLILKGLDHWVPDHDNAHGFSHECSEENVMHIGIMSSIAVLLHNMIEGMAVYSLTMESTRVGALVALGVGLHNIPMGMILAATLEHEPKKIRYTLLGAAVFSTFIGGLLMYFLSAALSEFFIGILIALTLGMLCYIIFFELIPHLMHNTNKKMSLLFVAVGMILIVISGFLE